MELHQRSAMGAYACLVGRNEENVQILIRLHGRFRLLDGSLYTPSQFEGHLIWNTVEKKPTHFRFFVPMRKTNVDVNRLIPARGANGEKRRAYMSVDIGYTPRMELIHDGSVEPINWTASIPLDNARKSLARRFYKFAEINWIPFEEAVAQSKSTKKPLHVVALFGTLEDESC